MFNRNVVRCCEYVRKNKRSQLHQYHTFCIGVSILVSRIWGIEQRTIRNSILDSTLRDENGMRWKSTTYCIALIGLKSYEIVCISIYYQILFYTIFLSFHNVPTTLFPLCTLKCKLYRFRLLWRSQCVYICVLFIFCCYSFCSKYSLDGAHFNVGKACALFHCNCKHIQIVYRMFENLSYKIGNPLAGKERENRMRKRPSE